MNGSIVFPDLPLLAELRGLIAGLCDKELTADQAMRLEEMVCTDSNCAAYFASAMEMHTAMVRQIGRRHAMSGAKLIVDQQSRDNDFWNDVVLAATVVDQSSYREDQIGVVPSDYGVPFLHGPRFNTLQFGRTWGVLACFVGSLLAVVLVLLAWSDGPATVGYVARLTKSRDAIWSDPVTLVGESTLRAGQVIALTRGVVEITFDSGAITTLEGPAVFKVESAREGFLSHGRLIATVPSAAHGFAIQTPSIRVVDLGTKFGIEVDDQKNAAVHVLAGVVEAYAADRGSAVAPLRIEANRAVRFDALSGRLGQVPFDRVRFQQIAARLAPPLITAVTANSGAHYQVVPAGLQEDARAYTDRLYYQWNGIEQAGIPTELVGADYVMTSNNDDQRGDLELQLTLSGPGTVYVFLDDRVQPVPDWIVRDYTDTGWDIGLDVGLEPQQTAKGPGESIDARFSVWKQHVAGGTITLGATNRKDAAHYGVAAKADLAKAPSK
jgi:hypothetical protein